MRGDMKRVMVGFGVAALTTAALQSPVAGVEARDSYPQPKAGSWKFAETFDANTGTLVVKAKKGKNPVVKKIRLVSLDPQGGDCPEAGTQVRVKGSFPLRKGPKWAGDDAIYLDAWISAKKDKKYDRDSPNELGMKTVSATVVIDGEARDAELAISFVKDKANKPHLLDFAMRVYPSSDYGYSGFCRYGGDDGKPTK